MHPRTWCWKIQIRKICHLFLLFRYGNINDKTFNFVNKCLCVQNYYLQQLSEWLPFYFLRNLPERAGSCNTTQGQPEPPHQTKFSEINHGWELAEIPHTDHHIKLNSLKQIMADYFSRNILLILTCIYTTNHSFI